MTLLYVLGPLSLSMLLFRFAQAIVRQEREIRENALLRRKVAIGQESVEALTKAQEAQRRILHDYDNHLAALHQLLAQGSHAHAEAYVRRLAKKSMPAMRRIRTHNDMLDAVLNQKSALAHSVGVRLEVQAGDMSRMPLQSDDAVVILANALDNALDACQAVPGDRWVRVKLAFEGPLFVISVENPVRQRVTVAGNRPPTTKSGPGPHGYGLANVEAALESYGGSYALFSTDDTFQFTAAVPAASACGDSVC